MPRGRRCGGTNTQGAPCNASARGESGLCLWHDPELAEAAQDARRLGGQRRRRDVTVHGAYDLGALTTIPEIRRVVEIVVTDMLGSENSVARARTLLAAAQVLVKLHEVGDLEERVAELESVLGDRVKGKGQRR